MNHVRVPPNRAFLLTEGGPLYRIERRVGFIRQNAPLTVRKAGVFALFAWTPLLILSVIQGTALGHAVPVPFLRDFGAYSRFLLAIPLLVVAEVVLGPMIAETVQHFVVAGLVESKDYERFDKAVEAGLRARDSAVAEFVLVILAYVAAIIGFRATSIIASSWYVTRTGTGISLTWAGWWLMLFSSPLLQFLLLRWLWRLFLWFQLLARICKLDLQLFPTHPDHAGGLGFVGITQRFFGILIFAYSVSATGVLANEILYDKIPLAQFAPAIGTYVVIALLLVLGPLAIFTGKLLRTKRRGLSEYGSLATSYTSAFHKKWICEETPDRKPSPGTSTPEREPLLGTGDIQSLADLGNSYEIIEKMNGLPLNPRTLIQLIIACLLPLTLLLLTVMPLKDLLKLLFKVVM